MSEDPSLAEITNRYEIGQQIGSGGFSTVYRAIHRYTTDVVAIKITTAGLEEHALSLFRREAEFLVKLKRQPNIVRVTDAGPLTNGRFYLVMDYYETSFDQIEDLTIDQTLMVGRKLAGALSVIHRENIVHKDVKPANIFANNDLEPALGDFGIATGGDVERSRTIPAFSFNYAAPEIFLGGRAEAPRDIYALGATLYHFLEGETPLARLSQGGQSAEQLALLISSKDPPGFRNPTVTDDVAAVILGCLARNPDDRPTADELAQQLDRVARPLPAAPDSETPLGRPPPSSAGPPSPPARRPLPGPPDTIDLPPLNAASRVGSGPPVTPIAERQPPAFHDATAVRAPDRHAPRPPLDLDVAPPPGEDDPGPAAAPAGVSPMVRRNRAALVASAAALLFLSLGALFFRPGGGPGDEPEPAPTPEEVAGAEIDAPVVLLPPDAVTVASNGDGTYTIEWRGGTSPVEGYWVSLVNSELAERADASPFHWEAALPPGVAACFELSTIGEGGMSFPSAPACG